GLRGPEAETVVAFTEAEKERDDPAADHLARSRLAAGEEPHDLAVTVELVDEAGVGFCEVAEHQPVGLEKIGHTASIAARSGPWRRYGTALRDGRYGAVLQDGRYGAVLQGGRMARYYRGALWRGQRQHRGVHPALQRAGDVAPRGGERGDRGARRGADRGGRGPGQPVRRGPGDGALRLGGTDHPRGHEAAA